MKPTPTKTITLPTHHWQTIQSALELINDLRDCHGGRYRSVSLERACNALSKQLADREGFPKRY